MNSIWHISRRPRLSRATFPAEAALVLVLAGFAAAPQQAAAQRLLIVNKSSNSVSIVDPSTRQEIGVVPAGFAPHEVAVSADGLLAYVTDYGTGAQPGSTITIVDLEQGISLGAMSLSPHSRPHGIVAASDGTIWVTTEGSQHVLHIDPIGRRILQEVETSQDVTHQVAISEGQQRVYTANIGSGTSTAIDARTGKVLAHIQTGAGAEGIDVSPDGDRVYVTNRVAGTLSEIDVASNQVIRTLPVGEFPIRVKMRPDGTELLVSNARGSEVVAVSVVGWRVVRRLQIGAFPVGILITPDNETAYVANTADDKVSVIDLVNWTLAGEILAGDEPDGMAWVPARPTGSPNRD
ncbi:MAG: YncE family protein [Gemmatimonadota bacterium]|nr:MAG: YncE family protein [Gemmatimonadota bacterium]